MKCSGRTLKQRLYGIKHLGSNIRRWRYFRGHGVHSPYVYSIVRQVFMCSELRCSNHDLYDALIQHGVARKRAIELQNLVEHCGFKTWCIDEQSAADLIVTTMDTSYEQLNKYAEFARSQGKTLAIIAPYHNANRWSVVERIIAEHPSTTVDNRGYLLVFNNHLPKQEFRL